MLRASTPGTLSVSRALPTTFSAPFEAGIREANAALILTGYDGNNDVPAACDRWLLKTVLRGEWGFTGAAVTDVGSQSNLQCPDLHHWSRTAAEACADQLAAGTDIIADGLPNGLVTAAAIEAVKQGLLKESDLDRAVKGMFAHSLPIGAVGFRQSSIPTGRSTTPSLVAPHIWNCRGRRRGSPSC